MITDLLIRNFKCFKNLTVPELGRVTLVAGRNNVGKTALIEALFLFLDRFRADMIIRQYGWRGLEGVASDPGALWGPVFYDYDMSQDILISDTLNGEPQSAQFRFNPGFIPPPPTPTAPRQDVQIPTDVEPIPSYALDIEYSHKNGGKPHTSHLFIESSGQQKLLVDYAKPSGHPAHFLPAKKHLSSKQIANEFSRLSKQGREDEVVEFLRIIEPRLETLKVITEGPGSSVYGKVEGLSRAIPIHFMGEGMEKLLALILSILHSENGCVFVDEIENGFHHSLLSNIWKAVGPALRKHDCQIICTTHSYELLHAAHEGLSEIPEDFRYIRLERKDQHISAKLSNYAMISAAIKTNMEVR
ncbi:MAG: AAA family ATPase [Planctomycetota bacterium]|jgi:predicted ATPase